jgi:hypothetical protein
LFSNLGVRRVTLSAEEYYGPAHFSQFETELAAVDDLVRRVLDQKPGAVVLSVVTWRGRVVPLAEIFRELRETLGEATPVLVADYSHGGAAGFPDIGGLDADIVCGDPLKWIARPEEEARLAFLRIRDGALLEKSRRVFQPFFLATAEGQEQLFARWLDPQEVQAAVAKLSEHGLDRDLLQLRHTQNLSLAKQLAPLLGLSERVQSSILWSEYERPLPDWLAGGELVWRPPGGGMRILCRADVKSADSACGATP